jgi:hypothetical protein
MYYSSEYTIPGSTDVNPFTPNSAATIAITAAQGVRAVIATVVVVTTA